MLMQYFDKYTSAGWQIIPVYRNSKIPVGSGWNEKYDKARSRQMVATGRYNMGLLLGDLVDVEGDSPEANDLLARLIDDSPHPMYRSSKSVHHLFKNPGGVNTSRFFDIEFRSHGVQSVLPPSIHEDGAVYAWLAATKFPVPEMPAALQDFYRQHYRPGRGKKKSVPQNKPKHKHGFVKTCCKICKGFELIHNKRLMLEVRAFRENNLPWMCHKCRSIDVREDCRRIRKEIERQEYLDRTHFNQFSRA